MRSVLKYLLFFNILVIAMPTAAQYIDTVCTNTLGRGYHVFGLPGSTFTWTITGGTPAPVTVNDTIFVDWGSVPGVYPITVLERTKDGCDGQLVLGNVWLVNNPVVFAGNDATICTDSSLMLSSSDSSYCTTVLWTTSGDGIFDNPALLHPVYTPGPADLFTGTVNLTITGQGLGASCPAASSVLVLTIIKHVIADAGPDVTACEVTPYTISGASASYYSSLLWTHNGAGMLLNPATIDPVYIPAPGESGTVTFTLHAYSIQPCHDSVVDQMVMTVYPLPTGTISLISGDTTCGGDTVILRIDLTGSPPWTFTYSDSYTTTTITTFTTPYFLILFPDTTVTYTLTALSDAHCTALPGNLHGSVTVLVHPKPGAEFTWNYGSQNNEIQFHIDSSVVDLGAVGYMVLWNFGDGTFGYGHNPVHIYPGSTTFHVILTVTDTNGCQNSVMHEVYVPPIPIAFYSSTAPTCLGSPMCFHDLSTVPSPPAGYIQIWIWDFGDGSPQDTIHFPNNPDVCHFYADIGTYPVTLKIRDNFGVTSTYVHDQTVIPVPIAAFYYTTDCENQPVQFTDASMPNGGGNILSWSWDFDDPGSGVNNTSTLQNPTHVFLSGNIVYSVRLIIQNFNGCRDTLIKPVFIRPKPPVDFRHDSACLSQTVTFYADTIVTQTDSIASWTWNFGDGSPPGNNPGTTTHIYNNSGTFTTTLMVVDRHGCENSVSHGVRVNPLPVPAFSWVSPSCQGAPVQFNDHSTVPPGYTGYVAKWQWDFDDGTPVQTIVIPGSPDITHTFAGPGLSFTVRLTVWTNDSCSQYVEHTVTVTPKPIADFQFPSINCFNLPVQFQDISQTNGGGNIISWAWNFNDPGSGVNNTSTLQNPLHAFTVPDMIYNVRLIVTAATNCADTIYKSIYIHALPPVDFSFDTTCVNSIVHFNGNSGVTQPGAIVLWTWDFGDGSPSVHDPVTTQHTYSGTGPYTASLTVTDTAGCSNTISHPVIVNPPPVADFTWNAPNCEGTPVQFTDMSTVPSGSTGFLTRWTWDFGDGTPPVVIDLPASPNISHTFAPGSLTHVVRLTVQTSNGCSAFKEKTVTSAPAPDAAFTYSSTSCESQAVQFTDQSQATGGFNIIQWNWNFGDPASGTDNQSTVQNPTHEFTTSGSFTVSLIVRNVNLCSDTITHVVNVNMKPVAAFTADTACLGNPTQFSDQSVPNAPGIISWTWNFGDGSLPATGQNPAHTYSDYGLFPVTLTIVNTNGCTKDTTRQVLVRPEPVPAFTFTSPSCLGAPVFYTDQSVTVPGYGEFIISWTWDFGDGSPPVTINAPASPNISHTFNGTALAHTVRLTVHTLSGCAAYVEHVVNSVPAPVAEFTFPGLNCASQTVQFTDNSQATGGAAIIQWNWNFGDPASGANNHSALQNPTHSFTAPGAFTVTLIVMNVNQCSDTITHVVNVNMKPVASFSADTACLGSATHFTDQSIPNAPGISSYSWNFGDGSLPSTQPDPTHIYSSYGYFPVTLTITNSNGCTKDTTRQVLVRPLPVPAFTFTGPNCFGTPIFYTDQSTLVPGYGESITSWTWDFGDGSSPVTINFPASPNISHIFNGSALAHTVRLTVNTNAGCAAYIEHLVNSVPAPLADFTFPATSCSMTPVQFTDQSQATGGYNITQWHWNFGDPVSGGNNTSTLPNPVHQFSSAGIFNVTMIITNEAGCNDTTIKPVTIGLPPSANFIADTACLGHPTSFTDQTPSGPGGGMQYLWDFGDGQTSTLVNPTHTYATCGVFPVTLTVTASASCIGDTVKNVRVLCSPAALFTASAPTCSGDTVQFTDMSSTPQGYIVKWSWNFGDGTGISINFPGNPDVSHQYLGSGIYNVTLTVHTSDSCTNTKVSPIQVSPAPIANFHYGLGNCEHMPVQFTDNSQQNGGGNITQWLWNFGDPGSGSANTSTLQNPTHSFTHFGTFNVLLTVTNINGCSASLTKTISINQAPTAQFIADNACENSQTHFTDQSIPNSGSVIAWHWNFGDPASGPSNTSTLQNPTHIFSGSGYYNVTLTVTNSGTCMDDTVMPVSVTPKPQAMFSFAASCVKDSTQFTDLSVAPGSQIIGWFWDFGDGSSPSTIQNPKHAYQVAGTYNVKLRVTNTGGCTDSLTQSVVSRPTPIAAYTYNSLFCPQGQVQFQDQSTGQGASIVERLWTFEPGYHSTLPDPVYVFSVTDTTYAVSLVVTDNFGCMDTIIDSVYVKPGFAFTFSYDTVCFNNPTHFTPQNLAPGDSLYYLVWDFGDPSSGINNISHAYRPEHTFTHAGMFTVKLKAWDLDNCADSVYKTVMVRVLPQVIFTSSSAPCDSLIHFTDQSVAGSGTISQWEWTFGDGSPPLVIPAPGPGNTSHLYAYPGDYTVTLKVTNSYGCSDTLSQIAQQVSCLSAAFTQDAPSCARYPVTFTDNSLPASRISSWTWIWGDGSDTTYSVYASSIEHVYNNAGTYPVTLIIHALVNTVQFTDSAMHLVLIHPTPETFFTNGPVCMNKMTVFHDTSETFGEPITSWHWNFGEPQSGSMNTSNIKNPNHTYDTSGVYVVKLVVSNRFGCQDSLTKITRVFGNPKAAFSNSEACSGNLTNFYDQSIIADTLTSYWFWNFGDPKSGKDFSYLKDPSYRYMKEGNYLVRLLVEDYNGCNDTVDSTVTVNPSPFGAFTVTDNLDGKPGRIQLNNESIGADSYNWDFGNGQSSTEENPIITYTEDGTYIIQLITDNKFHCKDTTYYKYEMLFKGLFIPNAMVPSSPYDGVRLFKPVGVNLKLYHIQVYDGWGHLLWESDKLDSQGRPLDGWDGTFKGAPMPQGTYMWKVDAVFNDNTEWTGSDIGKGKFGTSGTVTLIR